jgi:hypothetical protein
MKPKPATLETKNIGCYDVDDDVTAAEVTDTKEKPKA